jgi:hypothetical protein
MGCSPARAGMHLVARLAPCALVCTPMRWGARDAPSKGPTCARFGGQTATERAQLPEKGAGKAPNSQFFEQEVQLGNQMVPGWGPTMNVPDKEAIATQNVKIRSQTAIERAQMPEKGAWKAPNSQFF